MDEYNPYEYNFEPLNETPQETPHEPAAEPDYPYYQPYPAENQAEEPREPVYQYVPGGASSEKKPKKNRTGLKIAALIAAVGILGSIGGVLLSSAIREIRGGKEENPSLAETPVQQETVEAPKQDYTTVDNKLPDTFVTNSADAPLSLSQVYENTVNSVVGIRTEATTNVFGQEAVSASSGSGFVLSQDGYVITNAHVVKGADEIEVDLFNGESYEAELIGADADYDVAVLKIEATGLSPVSVGNSDALKVGQEVVAIGNPLGELTFTMTNGILSALDREINTDGNPQNMLQTNAAINSGNSGGPLFDLYGNVIGVTTAKYSGSTNSGTTIEGLGFAIPINTALKVAYDLTEYGYVRGQAFLGIEVKTLDARTAEYYGLPAGPRVDVLVEGSSAEKAGMQVGDIILEFNGVKVETKAELLSALRKTTAGETAVVKVFRAGAELEITVVLDEKPREEETSAQPETQQPQVIPDDGSGQGGSYYYQFPDSDIFDYFFPFG